LKKAVANWTSLAVHALPLEYSFSLQMSTSSSSAVSITQLRVKRINRGSLSATQQPAGSPALPDMQCMYETSWQAVSRRELVNASASGLRPDNSFYNTRHVSWTADVASAATRFGDVKRPQGQGPAPFQMSFAMPFAAAHMQRVAGVVAAASRGLGVLQSALAQGSHDFSPGSRITAEPGVPSMPCCHEWFPAALAASLEALVKVAAAEMPRTSCKSQTCSSFYSDVGEVGFSEFADAYGAVVVGNAAFKPKLTSNIVQRLPSHAHLAPMPRGSLADLKLVSCSHSRLHRDEVKVCRQSSTDMR
jgi:hypothetical protein